MALRNISKVDLGILLQAAYNNRLTMYISVIKGHSAKLKVILLTTWSDIMGCLLQWSNLSSMGQLLLGLISLAPVIEKSGIIIMLIISVFFQIFLPIFPFYY